MIDRRVFGDPDVALDHDLFVTGIPDVGSGAVLGPTLRRRVFFLLRKKLQREAQQGSIEEDQAQLQSLMIQYRDIGHQFSLDDSDLTRLIKYVTGHQTLIDCLRTARIPTGVRTRIEDSFFLPSSPLPLARIYPSVFPKA
jgi:hypothetical protein